MPTDLYEQVVWPCWKSNELNNDGASSTEGGFSDVANAHSGLSEIPEHSFALRPSFAELTTRLGRLCTELNKKSRPIAGLPDQVGGGSAGAGAGAGGRSRSRSRGSGSGGGGGGGGGNGAMMYQQEQKEAPMQPSAPYVQPPPKHFCRSVRRVFLSSLHL
jgi:hypothetical protein